MDEKKVREAIVGLKKAADTLKANGFKTAGHLDTAIEALEKQLSKKVKIKKWSPAKCPNCGTELSESLGDGYYRHPTFLKRCPNEDCGQLLDWGDN